jgi:hypothetical protein
MAIRYCVHVKVYKHSAEIRVFKLDWKGKKQMVCACAPDIETWRSKLRSLMAEYNIADADKEIKQ